MIWWSEMLRFVLFAACLTTANAASPIDSALRAGVEEHGIPGVVAMVATPDAIVYQGAFGKREVAGSVPMTDDTIFRIFSMTKPVTSVAIMQLVEQGKLKLDDPVSKWLAGFDNLRVITKFNEKDAT